MITEEEKIACTEIMYILSKVEKEYYNKIPKGLIELFKENIIKYYQYYDGNGNLKMSKLTEELLCYLNLEYWSTPSEKEELLKKYKENDENVLNQFDIYKKFEEKRKNKVINQVENAENIEENNKLIIVKKSFLRELFDKIRKIFH